MTSPTLVNTYIKLSATLLFIITFFADTGAGLRCFACLSSEDSRCGDKFELLPSRESTAECSGSCSKIRYTKGLTAVIHRGCVHRSKYGRSEGCFTHEFDARSATVCLCLNQNHCNLARCNTQTPKWTIFMIILATIFL